MPPLPSAARAALGLAAAMIDQARTLPDKAIELPMLAVSKSLQLSLRAQRGYAAMTSRGDEILASRQVTDDAPGWATFDDALDRAPVEAAEPAPAPSRRAAKTVRAPRNGAPSAFDTVAEE